MLFLQYYVEQWADADALHECWSSTLSFFKEHFCLVTAHKQLLPCALRIYTAILDKLAVSRYFEDARVRREAEDVYQKICDLCIIQGSKPSEHSPTRKSQLGAAWNDQPISNRSSIPLMDMLHFAKRRAARPEDSLVPSDNILYIAWTVVPNLRKLMHDQERILSLLTNAVYYIVSPSLKMRPGSKYSDKVPPALSLLYSMSRLPFATKAWKKDAWEVFMDAKFFNIGSASCQKWTSILQTLMVNDKEARITEVIGKIATVASGSIFVSKEQELMTRSYAIRRLSFLIWCGATDQYVPQLPAIQEKLVELLKGPPGLMHVEAYLCLRVMMLRMSTHHLSNLWPLVLTELIRLFGLYLQDHDTNDDLMVFLAG
ncbi:hypothetical protein HDV05_001545, partial [Chytridiales sp. JEL 0842]